MPTKDEFEEALSVLSQYVEDIGDEVLMGLDESEGMRIGPPDSVGFWCVHGSHRYAISGLPENKYIRIACPRLVISNIARKLEDDVVDELLSEYTEEEIEDEVTQLGIEMIDEEDIPEESEIISGREFLAAHKWLESLDSELRQEIRYHLKKRLSEPEVAYNLVPEDDTVVHGFVVTKKIFPYDGELSLQEFNDRVQAVISVASAGNDFLGTTFNITDEELPSPALPQ